MPRRFSAFLRTPLGRVFGASAIGFAVLWLLQALVVLPAPVVVVRRLLSVVSASILGWLAIRALLKHRRAFLWRVRRRLILSYVFLGVIPIALIGALLLVGGMLLYMTVASYVFNESYSSTVQDVRQIAETSAIEIGRRGGDVQGALDRKVENLAMLYPSLSMAVVPSAPSGARWVSGAWAHASAPASTPAWVTRAGGFAGTLVYVGPSSATDQRLVIRAAVPTPDRTRLVVADLPVDRGLVGRLKIRTAIDLIGVASSDCGVPGDLAALPARGLSELFTETTTFMDCTNWRDGSTGAVGLNLHAPVLALSDRLASVRSTELAERVGDSWWSVFVQLLILLTVLALIVQGAALVMGAVLAKSITSAVHELFTGTERIQQGDFSYRIPIESRDQLGDLASSFNRMSGSVEHLLVVQREKQRLDDELRIARDIQRSLLPPAPPSIAGLTIADLCEPAREVGGDYYDFFAVGPRQIGVLIADVSGKGTSAALYMAELKGLMLALSHEEPSPRQLLIDVNQRLADQLDNRSFITMTYAVIDLARGTLTVARAGHTPLILVSAGRTSFVMPDGMVVGLRLPGAEQRFEQLLTEETRSIHPNDIIVLYTDGVTEAMDAEGELFGHGALARVVVQHHERQPKEIREEILREIRRFSGDADPHDDMTMVILKVDPAPEGR